MKRSLTIAFIALLAGCSSPQSPEITSSKNIGFDVPDTIDLGEVRVGTLKDTTILFRNIGSDTILILSQRFSDSEFKVINSTQLLIDPRDSERVQFQFLPRIMGPVVCWDTIQTLYRTYVVVLRGTVIPFTSLANLSVIDTINFGVIKAGTTKDTSILFKNTGSDTLQIMSQQFSNSAFKLSKASQNLLTIPPGASQSVSIQFSPSDTSQATGFDTIHTAYKTYIIELQGNAIPFSSIFKSAPSVISISLSGVIGTPGRDGSPYTFLFSYEEPVDLSHDVDSSYSFYGSTGGGDVDSRGEQVDGWSTTTYIVTTIDANLIIRNLSVQFEYSYSRRGGFDDFSASKFLKLHDIALTKNGNLYVGTISSPSLSEVVDSISVVDNCPQDGTAPGYYDFSPPFNSLVGYTDSAKLSIIIK